MDLSGLNRFRQKLATLQSSNLLEEITREMVEEGTKYLASLYNNPSIIVTSVVNGNQAYIFAEGEKIAYLEYGTGLVGKGTYKGNLPTEILTFDSPKGVPQSTEGWVYYYHNELTKHFGGWFYKGEDGKYHFTRGMQAQAQVWKTAQYLREHASTIINRVLARHNI